MIHKSVYFSKPRVLSRYSTRRTDKVSLLFRCRSNLLDESKWVVSVQTPEPDITVLRLRFEQVEPTFPVKSP